MKALLPHIMKMLHGGYTNMKMKVLVVVRNVMGHLNRTEASQIAVQLVEDLLPLFDHVRLMRESEPRRWAPCKDSCPSAQPCGQSVEQGLLPRALVGCLLGFAAKHGPPLHLPSPQP